jgi:hypothetical protein
MSPGLKSSFQIAGLAADLRLHHKGDPVAAILAFCHKRINAVFREFRCATLSELMSAAAARLDTLFIEIHDDADLARLRATYLARGELVFATLAEQLGPHVYAITFKLTRPRDGDRRFVSIIDYRGDKAWRSYFSKWHELAHLLTLTPQARLKFCRTHAEPEVKDPEEGLMDVIAGEVGFCPQLVRPHATGEISFEKITALRERLCPDASQQASLIGLVKAWPAPCVLVEARPGLKAHERRSLAQERFPFHDAPAAVLRAVNVTANGAAERIGMTVHRNMRIPDQSVITRVFEDGLTSLEAEEDLAWWTSSNGRGLAPRRVTVKARRRWDAAEALIVSA